MFRKSLIITTLAFTLTLPSSAQQGRGRMMGGMGGMKLPDTITSDTNPVTPAKIDLGRMLFYDARLSKNHDVSCNSCHSLTNYGVDGKTVSSGDKGQLGGRNSPTVYNAAGHFVQFWDGRAATVEEQAKGPVMNPVEMAMTSEAEVVATLRKIPGYQKAFRDAFPGSADPVTFDNMARAIGAFERKLVTPSRWDRFMNGDQTAITSEEMAGHHQFMMAGCMNCHNGRYIGGQTFQKLGDKKAWPDGTDTGRMAVTGAAADRLMFKVPSLRNVEKTGPYFHTGKVATLQEAVRLMGEFQLDRKLDNHEISQIVAWLKTLTGEIPADYIRQPALPQ